MPLTTGDIAAIAREVVDRADPQRDIRIDPLESDDPYRWGKEAWQVSAGEGRSYITADMSEDEVRATLTRDLIGVDEQ